jgi:predicted nucleotidyltransferase
MRKSVNQFLDQFTQWASSQSNILAVALVGSHAGNRASDLSDVDLVVITTEPETYIQSTGWARRFGTIGRQQIEDYGRVTSLRVWYSGGHEVEYGFTDEQWSALPLDEGTLRVISDGLKILWERRPILSTLSKPESA